jgi:uncharacterized OB-fold protein
VTVSDSSLRDLLDESAAESPYWQALEEGRLIFPRCRRCDHAWLPPRHECPSCLAADWEWETASGEGRLISWVVYHVAYHDAFADRLPYSVAVVELAEGPRLVTNLVDAGDRVPTADAAVTLQIEHDGGLALARFRLA